MRWLYPLLAVVVGLVVLALVVKILKWLLIIGVVVAVVGFIGSKAIGGGSRRSIK